MLTPIRIALIYIVFGNLWILYSDQVLNLIAPSAEFETTVQSFKDFFFIFISGLMLYGLIRHLDKLHRTQHNLYKEAERITKSLHWQTDEKMKELQISSESGAFIFGIKPDDYMGHIDIFESRILPEDHVRIRKIFDDLPQNPRSYELEYRYTKPDGELIWIKETGEPVYNTLGKLIHFRGTSQDITKLKNFEYSLVQAKSESEIANRAKSDFMASMSHDLRTPLNSIIGYSEMIMSEILGPINNEKYVNYLQSIHMSGHRLLSMINDVLDLSKIEAGKMELDETYIDISQEFVDTKNRFDSSINTNSTPDIVININANMPMLYADIQSISQILDNLITNAIKYAGSEAVITLGWVLNSIGNGVLSVSDTGTGIPAMQLEKIKIPFVQGNKISNSDASTKQDGMGVGLGLSIVTKLSDIHDANFVIESTEGEGTSCKIIFDTKRLKFPEKLKN